LSPGESLYDTTCKKWASRATGVTVAGMRQQTAIRVIDQEAQSSAGTGEDSKTQGWALKSTNTPSRMTDKTKTYTS